MVPAQPSAQPELRRALCYISGFCCLFFLALMVMHFHWQNGFLREGINNCDFVLGRDFLQFWNMGRAAWQTDPGRYYDINVYLAALHTQMGEYCTQQWSYPPSVLLIAAPFGQLPYLWALLVWSVLGLLLVVVLSRREPKVDSLLVLLSPAAFLCLLSGQNSLFTLILLYSGFRLRKEKPALAGVLFGLLSLKPQLALLVPALLLAERNWRAIGTATLTALLLIALTGLIFGWSVWVDFWKLGLPAQHLILTTPPRNIEAFMPTVFMDLRAAGADYATAMTVQLLFALGAMFATYRFFRKGLVESWSFLLFAALSVLSTPYAMGYDLLALALGITLVLAIAELNSMQRLLLVAAYWLPFLHYVAIAFHISGMALLPLPIVWVAWRKGKASTASNLLFPLSQTAQHALINNKVI